MKKLAFMAMCFCFCSLYFTTGGCCRTLKQKKQASVKAPTAVEKREKSRAMDTNKDGKPDVWYFSKDNKVYKVEVDSNKDGKPDVIHQREPDGKDAILVDINKDGRSEMLVTGKSGKFQSAVVDDNGDGKFDKIISNSSDFKTWLNSHDPAYKNALNKLRAAEKNDPTILFEF